MKVENLISFNRAIASVIYFNVDITKVIISKIECRFNKVSNEYECEIIYSKGGENKIFKYSCMDDDIISSSCRVDLKFFLKREGLC